MGAGCWRACLGCLACSHHHGTVSDACSAWGHVQLLDMVQAVLSSGAVLALKLSVAGAPADPSGRARCLMSISFLHARISIVRGTMCCKGAGRLWCTVDLFAGVAGAVLWEACLRVIQMWCTWGSNTRSCAALVWVNRE